MFVHISGKSTSNSISFVSQCTFSCMALINGFYVLLDSVYLCNEIKGLVLRVGEVGLSLFPGKEASIPSPCYSNIDSFLRGICNYSRIGDDSYPEFYVPLHDITEKIKPLKITEVPHSVILHIDRLNISLPSNKRLLLKNFSLSMYPGMKILITGPSGCGRFHFILNFVSVYYILSFK